jgi:ABC-type multidrug transport system fused ATPase/permease subunit
MVAAARPAVARAVLADPHMLVLDKATSSVDTRTEARIQEAMLPLMAGRTSLSSPTG